MALLQEYLARQAELRPDHVAVSLGGDRLTYADLERRANRLAWLLREAGCRRGDRIAMLVPKSPLAIVCIHAALKAGCLYVPIDPESPAARVARILTAAESRYVMVTAASAGRVAPLMPELERAGCRGLLLMDEAGPGGASAALHGLDAEAMPETAPPCSAAPSDPAEILFTSGSTGVPKGVLVTHANIAAFIDWAVPHFGIGPGDRNSGHSPLHFDLSTFDLYGSFAAGAELCLVPPDVNVLPQRLPAFIREARLTQWFSVPSALAYVAKFDAVGQGDFPELRRLIWCGEVFPPHALRYWLDRLPHVAFTNLYGPTEATIASSWYTVPRPRPEPFAGVPIGRPCAGEELLVLGPDLSPLPAGETGDIWIRGAGVTPGYWRDPEKTAAAFRQAPGATDPTDRIYRTGDLGYRDAEGLVWFLGRADTQIKSRGHRIELGEIEAALDGIAELEASAVVAVETGSFEGTEICCAFVPKAPVFDARALRGRLATLVPRYMLPHRFASLDRMPSNANGKIDRAALKAMFAAAPPS